MKKIGYGLLILSLVLCFAGCQKQNENISGSLSDIMKEVYKNIPEDELPELINEKVNKDNQEYYLGSSDITYKEALASEPLMSSVAHSVVLVRANNVKDVDNIKKEIKEKIDPRKWICVGVDEKNVFVESKGDLVILIMDNEYASTIRDNFLNLK